MKSSFLLALAIISFSSINAQVGIGTTTPDVSSMMDISSTDKGLLIPRLTTGQRLSIADPANGLIIYNTDSDELQINTNTSMAPIWEAISLTASTGPTPGNSAKYSNTDITTDVNDSSMAAPLFGTLEWNDDATLYDVTGNEMTVTTGGRYEIIVNVSLENMVGGDRTAPEIRLAVNGTTTASYGSTGYMRSASGHENASIHIREVLELSPSDILTVDISSSANTAAVNLRSVGSSNFYIEKLL